MPAVSSEDAGSLRAAAEEPGPVRQHSQAGREVLLLTEGSKHHRRQGLRGPVPRAQEGSQGRWGSLSDVNTLHYAEALMMLCSEFYVLGTM